MHPVLTQCAASPCVLLLLCAVSEVVLSYNQSLTSALSVGVQLHSALGMVNFLNFTSRYTTQQGDTFALTHKNQQLLVSYHRTVFEQAATQQMPPSRSPWPPSCASIPATA